MIDVEALAKAAGLLWAGRDVWDGPEAWSNEATPLLGPELGSVKCAALIRALKPS
jgi:hypothetical protein